MTLTYGGYDIAPLCAKYGDAVVPRIVQGPNPFDSVAGTHWPDDLDYKDDLTVKCRPLSGAQWNLLRTLMRDSVTTPYKQLKYTSGDVNLSGQYKISVTSASNVMETSERELYDGAYITFTQQ